jgi:hypothetical protein
LPFCSYKRRRVSANRALRAEERAYEGGEDSSSESVDFLLMSAQVDVRVLRLRAEVGAISTYEWRGYTGKTYL